MDYEVEKKLNELLAIGSLRQGDPKFNFFKEKVLPSVVFQWKFPNGENSFHFRCPFENCHSLCSRSVLLERHLKEQHHDQIPFNVFGSKSCFQCSICNTQVFKRLEHLQTHKKGNKHLRSLIQLGLASEEEINKWRQICSLKKQTRSFDSPSSSCSNSEISILSLSSSQSNQSLLSIYSKSNDSILEPFDNKMGYEEINKGQNVDFLNNLSLNDLMNESKTSEFFTSTPSQKNKSIVESEVNAKSNSNILSLDQHYISNRSDQILVEISNPSIRTIEIENNNIKSIIYHNNNMITCSYDSEISPGQPSYKKRKLSETFEQNLLSLDSIESMILTKRTLTQNDYDII